MKKIVLFLLKFVAKAVLVYFGDKRAGSKQEDSSDARD
jgi:hypothetical protein